MVGELILVTYHVVVLDAVEFSFKFPDFGAICIHLLTGARPVFVKLVDDQRRVPIYHEAFDAELNGYTKSVETCFIFAALMEAGKCIRRTYWSLSLVGVMNKMPAPAPLMLRVPSKYITQCSGQVAGMGSWILVHSAMKSASACDLKVGLLLNSME